ncbi:hypothetical protein Tco_1517813 [Tanacetum coccineum]
MTPPLGFSTSPQIPYNTTSERSPTITTVFAATTLENTPFAYRASTSTNPNPMISLAFVEANYEDYNEEREIEPRPEPNYEATPTLRPRSPVVRRKQERVVGFKEAPNREGSRRGRNAEGIRPLEIEAKNRGVNLPPLLAAHLGRNENGQPLRSSLTSVQGGHHPSTNMGEISLLMAQIGNPPIGETQPIIHKGGICHIPSPTMAYLHIIGSFIDSIGSVTPFVYWIEEYPLSDGLKIPSYIGSYDGKGDPDNFLHLFEGAVRIQKTGSILNYEDLKAKFWSHFGQQKKFTKIHLAVHNINQRDGESTRAFINRYIDDTLQILGLHEEQRISGFVHGLRTRNLVEHLSTDLPSTYKGLMEKNLHLDRSKRSGDQ